MPTISKQTGKRSLHLTAWDHKEGKGGLIIKDGYGVQKCYALDRVSKTPSTETYSLDGKDEVYEVIRTPGGWCCNCKGFRFKGFCKHSDGMKKLRELKCI